VLFVRFAGNDKGVAFQTEEALKLLRNGTIIRNDAHIWKKIAAEWVSEVRIREEPSGTAKALMERIKRQLDPKNILAADGLRR
jgi:FAD/FMN-containing dehydrogenase